MRNINNVRVPDNAQSEPLIMGGSGDRAGDWPLRWPCASLGCATSCLKALSQGDIKPPQGGGRPEPTSVALLPGISQVAPAAPPDPQPAVTLPSGSKGPQCDGGWDLVVLESKAWADLAPANTGSALSFFQ